MTKASAYNGYKSFEYLTKAGMYKTPYNLVKEIGRVPSKTVRVTEEQEKKVQQLLEDNIVISLHDHPTMPEDAMESFQYFRDGYIHMAYEGLSQSGLDVIFDNLLDGACVIHSKRGWKWIDTISDIGHQDFVIHAKTVDDIKRAKANGQVAWVANLEASTSIENELERLDILYGLGVRVMGIAYSEANSLGSGLREDRDAGLTNFGKKAVKRMNALGIAIDISHSGDLTSMDTIETSDKPIFITHARAREVWPTPRLKPDEILQACAEKGGVIGIEAARHTTMSDNYDNPNIESFMEHFEYCVDLVGIDHVSFGPDATFGDHVGLHHAFAAHLAIASSHSGRQFEESEYVDGLENPAECFPNIVRWLVKHEYSDEDIAKAIGGNIMRVLEQVW